MTKQKILIADDEAQIREILRIYFEKEDFQVIEAEDGAAAILKVQSEEPDILLLDIMMPVLDGIEVCKQVRKISNVPIIMVTRKPHFAEILLPGQPILTQKSVAALHYDRFYPGVDTPPHLCYIFYCKRLR